LTGFILVFSALALPCLKTFPTLKGIVATASAPFRSGWASGQSFNLARGILTGCYLGVILVAPWLMAVNRPFLAITHGLVLAVFWMMSFRVNAFTRE
jgi:homogentisate phytyltransferase/homogentisate geranylgeranyltransferase